MGKLAKRLKRFRFSVRKRVLKYLPGVLHIGQRALLRGTMLLGQSAIEKQYSNTQEGRRCYEREQLGQKLFGQRPWMIPMVDRGQFTLLMPRYQECDRLDVAAAGLSEEERRDLAGECVKIAWEIFDQGYAHRDFQPRNLFRVKGKLVLTDFETLEPYPDNAIPPFPQCYDLTGQGLPSPFLTGHMGYASPHKNSLQSVLGIRLEEALPAAAELLKERLREASLSFQSGNALHLTRAERIYGSFQLPHLEVTREEAQRDSAQRMKRFGIGEQDLAGRRVLDLGCHFGAMLFQAQSFRPGPCLGIEFDEEKVRVARSIARYNGLRQIEFRVGDVDQLEPQDLGKPFDTVCCFAINRHVKNPIHLYTLLGQVTQDTLYFEGNGGSDVPQITDSLRQAGFASIQFLGMSDDDCLPKNNNRPLFVARRRAP